MPNSLLQAMAAARPVAAVDVGDLSRIVAPENRPLVVPRDRPGAMAEALAALAGDAPRRQVLGRLNQERVKAEYSLEALIAAYRALLGARGGAAGKQALCHLATWHPNLLNPPTGQQSGGKRWRQ